MSAIHAHITLRPHARRLRRGNDGLTKAERAEHAARWTAGIGAKSSKQELAEIRRLLAEKKR